jgi:hypothetical protein
MVGAGLVNCGVGHETYSTEPKRNLLIGPMYAWKRQ